MKEQWKDIPGYEGRYQASNMGRIRSLDRQVNGKCYSTGEPCKRKIKGKILKHGRYCKSGHVSVVLGRGTFGKPVHQLVMLTFVGETPEGMEILHGNGNPQDNSLANLRFGTRRENILDVYRQGRKLRKLSIDDVYNIRFEVLCGFTNKKIAERYNVSPLAICRIRTGRSFGWLE